VVQLAEALRSSAWAELLREQQDPSPSPVESGLTRAIAECRLARVGIAASFAEADRDKPAPTWLREWVSCLDDLLAVTERLHAHVEAQSPG
jgi:hypothetical protein